MIESRPGLVVFISELRRSIRALFIAIVVVTGVAVVEGGLVVVVVVSAASCRSKRGICL